MAYDSGIEKHTSKLLEEASKSISRFVRGEIEELETRNYHLSRSNDDLRKELYQYNIRINNLTAQLGFGSLAEAEESLTEDPPLNAENSSRVNVDLYNKYMAIAEQRVTLQEEVSRLSSENEKLKGDINLLRHEVGEGLKSSETHAKALQLIESLTSKNAELEGRLEKELQIYEKNSKRKEAAMVALQDRVRHLEEQSSAHRTATSNVDQMVPTHDKENGISVPLHDATNSPASRNSILPSDKPYHDASYEGLKTIHRLLMEKYDALRGEYTKRNNEFEDAKTTWERRFHELANKVIESSKRALKKMHGEKVAGTIGDDHGAAGIIMEKFMESWHESFSDLISSTPDKDKDAPDKPKHSNLATRGPSEIEAEGGTYRSSGKAIMDGHVLCPRNSRQRADPSIPLTPAPTTHVPPPSPTESDSPLSQPLDAKIRQLQSSKDGSHQTPVTPFHSNDFPPSTPIKVEEIDNSTTTSPIANSLFDPVGEPQAGPKIASTSANSVQPEAGPSRYTPRPPSTIIHERLTHNPHFTPKGRTQVTPRRSQPSVTDSNAEGAEDEDVPFTRPPPTPKGKERVNFDDSVVRLEARCKSSPPDSPTKHAVLGKRMSPSRISGEDSDVDLPGPEPRGSKEERERYFQELKKKPHYEYMKEYAQYKGHGRYAQSTSNGKPTIGAKYEINKDRNGGVGFQYDSVVRDKAQRKKMDGGDCVECQEYYKAVGYLEPIERGPRWRSPTPSSEPRRKRLKCQHHGYLDGQSISRSASDSMVDSTSPSKNEFQDRIEEHQRNISRHRHDWARPKTPPNYWHIGFPDTQEIEDINRRAEANHQAKLREIEREANKKDGKYKRR